MCWEDGSHQRWFDGDEVFEPGFDGGGERGKSWMPGCGRLGAVKEVRVEEDG